MLNEFVILELEADLVASFDLISLSSGALSALVADEVGRVDHVLGERRHVRVGVLADVSVVSANGLVVDDELGEDVVSVDEVRCQQRSSESESEGGHNNEGGRVCRDESGRSLTWRNPEGGRCVDIASNRDRCGT